MQTPTKILATLAVAGAIAGGGAAITHAATASSSATGTTAADTTTTATTPSTTTTSPSTISGTNANCPNMKAETTRPRLPRLSGSRGLGSEQSSLRVE